MKLAIMQPYFFPYLGYFQLVHAVDTFVFYDDVNYIKNGWINRNRLLLNGEPRYFTVPLSGASPFAPIDATGFDAEDARWKRKMLETFRVAYRKAPHRDTALGLLEACLGLPSHLIGELARHSVVSVLDLLGVRRAVRDTSRIYGNGDLKGPARVVDICRREGASTYVNAPGGRALYDDRMFRPAGIELKFLDGTLPAYSQDAPTFVAGLSILDALAWCSTTEVGAMLGAYRLSGADSASSSS
jgi:hypothetical protein